MVSLFWFRWIAATVYYNSLIKQIYHNIHYLIQQSNLSISTTSSILLNDCLCTWGKYFILIYYSLFMLTHWGWVIYMISKLTIIGSDSGLLPCQCQTIIWTNTGILLIGPLGTNFSDILIEMHTFSFKEMHLKVSSAKWWPFCLGFNVLSHWPLLTPYANIEFMQYLLR